MKRSTKRLLILKLVFVGLILSIPLTALATPITINSITYGTGNAANVTINSNGMTVYTEYYLNTTIGQLDAFCVDPVQAGTGAFNLITVDPSLYDAAWVAEKYWNAPGAAYDGGFFTKEDTQIVVWELSFDTTWDLNSGVFKYNSGANINNINAIYSYLSTLPSGYTAGDISIAHEALTINLQDFMVNVPIPQEAPAPIPEPATMLLLGTGLVGIAGVTRRKKKHQA